MMSQSLGYDNYQYPNKPIWQDWWKAIKIFIEKHIHLGVWCSKCGSKLNLLNSYNGSGFVTKCSNSSCQRYYDNAGV